MKPWEICVAVVAVTAFFYLLPWAVSLLVMLGEWYHA